MKKLSLLNGIIIATIGFNAHANLDSQLNAIKGIEQDNQKKIEEENARQARARQEAARKKALAEKKAYDERMAKIKAQKERDKAKLKAEQDRVDTLESERLADKYREQEFEDQLRQMQLEEMRLELERKKTRVAREGDVIDSELASSKAETDQVQSVADSNRNISSGVKSALESEGKAKEEEASSWFN
ncbi:DUF5384 family protein [Vibrio sp. 10N.261.46.A3]|uniref:DUF5384 family protein n=1 Tax=Vibrio sp. 10N.261.46.A3 TaxID=3229658 RepID=UPI003553C19F